MKSSSSSGIGSALVRLFDAAGTQDYTESKKDYWLSKQSSLDDQMSDLNTYSGSSFEYEFNGSKIIPKSLKVSKIQSSTFKKVFRHINQTC